MSTESTRSPVDSLSRRLLDVHERELRRIAQELRENVSQQLALCLVEIDRIQGAPSDSTSEKNSSFDTLHDKVLDAYGFVQSLSHELHSPVLEHVGLAAAMRSLCGEFAERHQCSVEFAESDVPPSVPPEISTPLFRVLQEALNNTVAHRGSMTTEIKLQGRSNEINLFIWGLGGGAGRVAEAGGDGPDLIAMRERIRLVEGSLSISANLQIGIQITARVPL